ncbi:hypothetical protein EVJ58_g1081 [Rhodofomes roseus]|nr:hypothetical protein EVJ58_g1081 [Rhodofomes roseus]
MYGLLWQQQPKLDDLLRLLSSIPHLQTLFFVNCGMKIARNHGGNASDELMRTVVPLRDMRSLKLKEDSRRPLVVIRKYISIPTTATVDVDADHAFMPYPLTWSRDVRDPGAIMVMGWMRRLQLAFLERGLTDEDVLGADKLLTIVEDYKDMTAERLAFSNIMMVVRRIFSLPAHKVHRSGEFKFRKRAYVLYLKWQAIAGSGR